LLWRVLRLIPRISAARALLLSTEARVLRISAFSVSSTVEPTVRVMASGLSTRGGPAKLGGRCARVMSSPSHVMAARCEQVRLAKAEIRADVRAELAMLVWLAAAILCALFGLNLLLVAAVFAMAKAIPMSGLIAAIWVAGLLLLVAITAGLVGWSKRVTAPFAKTRESLSEGFQ
jgi:uncharacterized membrane protein YqjE